MKNFVFCAAGVALGFFVGFLVANTMSQPQAAAPQAARATQAQGDPGRFEGELPPNHPDIGALSGNDSPAANSAEAQSAMEAADASPRDFAAQMEAAETFYGLHDYQKAELYAGRALDINPDDAKALVLMGNAKYDRRDYAGAAGFYERALAKNPDDPNVRTDFGNTFFLREPPDLDRAIAEYRKSIATDPRHEQSWLNLASASIQKRDKTAALEALTRLESINPQNTSLATLRQNAQAIP
jgi:tetratricopeptide (TPR) repeat protein